MVRGFIAGTLTLIVLYVIVQPGAAERTGTAGDLLTKAMRRWLASSVAGVPDRSKSSGKPFVQIPSSESGSGTGTGSTTGNMYTV